MLKKAEITKTISVNDLSRKVILIDVKDQILGRLAVQIVRLIQGKHKSNFSANLNCGDYVVVINTKNLKTTGRKKEQKIYTHYTGYPGGLRTVTLGELLNSRPEKALNIAVSGMLPNNKLRNEYLKNLFIFSDDKYELPENVLKILQAQKNA